jgi:Zinc finger, C2H2 type
MSKPETSRPQLAVPYSQMPPVSAAMSSGSQFSSMGYGGSDVLSLGQDIPRSQYSEPTYSASTTSGSTYAPTYPTLNYAHSLAQQQQQQHDHHRKMSHRYVQPYASARLFLTENSDGARAATASFGELDASRGMLALSHQNLQDLTPRNIFEARAQRGSTDSYGFPATSAHSSISNESGRGYPYYASSVNGSVADSATDYSSAASDAGYDTMASRTLPRPSQLIGASLGPPAPQSMMGQFSSKLSANTQKKHKCKICDKRFTRPSSLQTHMYSHTGEKPFACNVEGCGRQFSVVSNLRRHKKVHKNESTSPISDTEE